MSTIEHTGIQTRGNSLVTDLVVLLVITLIGLVCTYRIEKFIDIELYDETYALFTGLSIRNGAPSAEFSPLYALWYYLLSFVEHDTVSLYYLNFKAVTILPPLALFLALRVNRVSRILSFALSLGLLFSGSNLPVWPKVSHFAVFVLLLGLTVSSLSRDFRLRISILAVAALVTSYVRPEYFLSFVLLGLTLVVFSVRTIRTTHSIAPAVPPGLVFIAFAVLVSLFGFPVGSGNRSMIAFGQHYAINHAEWHNDPRNPWTHWEQIVAADFGEADSPAKAMMANPMAMTRHVITNLRNLPHEAIAIFGSTYPSNRAADTALRLGVLIVLAGGILTIWSRRRTMAAYRFIHERRHLWPFLIFPLALLLPSAISITMIAPRHHYLFVMGVILVFSGVVFLFRDTDQHPGDTNYSTLGIVCLLPFLTVRPWHTMTTQRTQPNLRTIEFLRSLEIDRPVNLLEAQGGYDIYAGTNYKRVAEFEKNTPFRVFMTARSIDMIILSDLLCNDSRFINDPEWQSLIKSPAEWGFTHVSVPGVTERSLLIKEGIVSRRWRQD